VLGLNKVINTPFSKEMAESLNCGDSVYISGVIYTARDAAHKKMVELIDKGEKLPIELQDSIIYYVGPTPAKPGMVIGSAGPTTSGRMDAYAPKLMDLGLRGMIGKGSRNSYVIESMVINKAVYFAAIGGAGALIGKCIKSVETVAYEELGAEAIMKLQVENFPVIVAVDSRGNSIYKGE
jgi:fumarate hydratase subunit beta